MSESRRRNPWRLGVAISLGLVVAVLVAGAAGRRRWLSAPRRGSLHACRRSRRLPLAVTAIVLITCEVDRTSETAEALADLDGISEVYSVAGDWDLVAVVRVGSHDDLAAMVTERVRKTSGVASTRTLIAFRTYSRHDLDRMFSVGFEAAGQPD